MIPKKIHYCWFGGNPLPDEAKKCIESWKKYCPDYEIIEWNESNYDLNKNEYVKKAYEQKKYAFLTDYVRLDVIYEQGGIYLDTDVELIKNLDDLIENECYVGMEQPGRIATGLGFGAIKKHPFVKENKEYYENNTFWDEQGKFKKVICVEITSDILSKYGLKNNNEVQYMEKPNVTIYPPEYFCPLKMGTNKLTITRNTYSIHHYDGSWKSNSKIIRKLNYYSIPLKQKIKRIYKNLRKMKLKDMLLNDDNNYLEKVMLVYIFINTLFKAIGFDSSNIFYLIFFFLSLIPLSIKLINTKYEKNEKIFIIISLILGAITFCVTTKPTFLITVLTIIGLKNIDVKKMLKAILNIRVITFITITTLAILGFIDKGEMIMWRNNVMDIRFSLGYLHPNSLHLSLFLIIALFILCYYKKLKPKHYGFMIMANIITYGFSVSRTGLITTFLLIILAFITTLKQEKTNKYIINSCNYVYIILLVLSILTSLLFPYSHIIENLSAILNGRIEYGAKFIQKYGITLFGSNLNNENMIIDNSYLYMLIQYGIAGLSYFSFLFWNLIKKIKENIHIEEAIVVIMIFIYMFTESFVANIFMNIILLLVTIPYGKQENKVVEK